jgi:hypothetical protein
MPDFDPSNWSVNWADATSGFFAIDASTYIGNVNEVFWTETGENATEGAGNPMARVTFKFPEVRVTKPKKGRPKGSNEQETVTEYGRELRSYYTFGKALGIAKAYLVGCGVATAEELEEEMSGPEIVELFNKTQGAEVAVRVQKATSQREGMGDDNGMTNNVRGVYGPDTAQYRTAASASSSSISKDNITFGGKKK